MLVLVFILNFLPSVISGEKFTVKLAAESYLVVNGNTNIGDFQCFFDMTLLTGLHNITIRKEQNGCLNFSNFNLTLPVENFNCGKEQVNKDFRELLNHHSYPEIIWDIKCLDTSMLIPKPGKRKGKVRVNSMVEIAGIEQEYWLPVYFYQEENQYSLAGELVLNINDFNLEAPQKMFGLIEVYPTIFITFSLNLRIQQ